jgi:hypothetical protein
MAVTTEICKGDMFFGLLLVQSESRKGEDSNGIKLILYFKKNLQWFKGYQENNGPILTPTDGCDDTTSFLYKKSNP